MSIMCKLRLVNFEVRMNDWAAAGTVTRVNPALFKTDYEVYDTPSKGKNPLLVLIPNALLGERMSEFNLQLLPVKSR